MEPTQLAQLLRASRNGDGESFGRLVSAYQRRVCALAHDPAAVEFFNRWLPALLSNGR